MLLFEILSRSRFLEVFLRLRLALGRFGRFGLFSRLLLLDGLFLLGRLSLSRFLLLLLQSLLPLFPLLLVLPLLLPPPFLFLLCLQLLLMFLLLILLGFILEHSKQIINVIQIQRLTLSNLIGRFDLFVLSFPLRRTGLFLSTLLVGQLGVFRGLLLESLFNGQLIISLLSLTPPLSLLLLFLLLLLTLLLLTIITHQLIQLIKIQLQFFFIGI